MLGRAIAGTVLGLIAVACSVMALAARCNQTANAATATLAPAPPVVCVATDAASWTAAVQQSWTRDVLIYLHAELPYSGNPWDYIIGRPGGTVEIVGGTLDLSERSESVDANGLLLTGARATLRGVTVRGVNLSGSAIRADVTDTLEVFGCTVRDCGTQVLTAIAPKPRYTNGIGVHSRPRRVVIIGNTFERVALNDEQLAHVLYTTVAGEQIVSGNTYTDCGSVWGCYAPRVSITNETVDAGSEARVWDRRQGRYVHPWLLVYNGGGLTFAGNTIRGTVDHVWHGNQPRGVIAGNQYGCTARTWALLWGVGEVSRETWATRFDMEAK